VKRNTWLVWGAVLVVVVVAVIAAAASGGGGGDSAASGGSGSTSSGKAAVTHEQGPITVHGQSLPKFPGSTDDPAVGKTMPTVTGVSVFDGSPIVLKPTGKPQLLVFVAHWCPHCQKEVPAMVALAKAGKLAGVDVTAIATGTNKDYPNYPPSAWLKSQQWPFPVLADSTNYQAAVAFGLAAYPQLVFIDGKGTVVGRASGEQPDDALVANVKALVAGQPLPLLESGASSSA
jgi:thiol-disulfide isomerase/thioredoxin